MSGVFQVCHVSLGGFFSCKWSKRLGGLKVAGQNVSLAGRGLLRGYAEVFPVGGAFSGWVGCEFSPVGFRFPPVCGFIQFFVKKVPKYHSKRLPNALFFLYL